MMIPVVGPWGTRRGVDAVLLLLAVGVTTAAWAADVAAPLGAEPVVPAPLEADPDDVIARLLPPRTDQPGDWYAPLEPLHACGEPRALPSCVPPAPCHPACPPRPFDLVGVRGAATCGPIYRGPCAPRTGTHDDGPLPRLHRIHDRLFDWFYSPRTPLHP